MNAFRVRFSGASARQLLIQSTLDKSYWLNPKEDEEVQFDKNALMIFKNTGGEPVTVKIRCEKVDRPGAGIVFRSTRRAAFLLGVGDSQKICMGGGETFTIRGEDAINPRDATPVIGAV